MNKIKLYLKSIISNKILCLDNKLRDVKTSFNFKGDFEQAMLFDSIEAANKFIELKESKGVDIINYSILRPAPIEYKSKNLYFYYSRDHENKTCECICFYENILIDYNEGRNKLLIAINSSSCMLIEHNRDHEFFEIIEHIEHLKN